MATSAKTQSITNGQIGQINDRLATKLRESGLCAEGVQVVLAAPGGKVFDEMVAMFRKFVEAVSNLIVRIVKPNRSLAPRQALEATGRNLCVDDEVVATMPRGEGGETKVVFFKPEPWEYTRPGFINDEDLDKAYERRGFKPADPYSLAKSNEDDPAFADDHPNGTHWRDENGKWCFVTFDRWGGGRHVYCDRNERGWDGYWWFAALRK